MYKYFMTHDFISKENTPVYKNILPEESFLKFFAYRLRNARVAWINFDFLIEKGIVVKDKKNLDMLKQALLDSFAYMIPKEDESEDIFDFNNKKEFMADRYGDVGEICNGGGVRCGLNGNFQIKGIGRSKLAGRNMDYWHSHGGATIEEGVREALWGEVLNRELPHGAVRILAVIDTGKTTPYDFGLLSKNQKNPPGGLIVREMNIRPPHYERAVYYKPLKELGNNFVHDAIRTEKSVDMIEKSLKIDRLASEIRFDNIVDTIMKLSEKIAEQVACSKMLRIAHGALTPGNMEINGRYIDFGTTTSLSGFGNPIVSFGFPAIWAEPMSLASNLKNFTFYIHKYINKNANCKYDVVSKLIEDYYYKNYVNFAHKYIMFISGFSKNILEEDVNYQELSSLLIDLAKWKTLENKPLGEIPDSLGGCDFFGFMKHAAKEGINLSIENCPKDVLEFAKINKIIELYILFFKSVQNFAGKNKINNERLSELMVNRIDLFEKDLSLLYRDRLQKKLSLIINDKYKSLFLCENLNNYTRYILDKTVRNTSLISDFDSFNEFKTLVPGSVFYLTVLTPFLNEKVKRIFIRKKFIESFEGNCKSCFSVKINGKTEKITSETKEYFIIDILQEITVLRMVLSFSNNDYIVFRKNKKQKGYSLYV